jgi:hypothetical protein
VGGAGDLLAEADMGAGAARSLAAADALNKADHDNCVCSGRHGNSLRYQGSGCNCWISCSG